MQKAHREIEKYEQMSSQSCLRLELYPRRSKRNHFAVELLEDLSSSTVNHANHSSLVLCDRIVPKQGACWQRFKHVELPVFDSVRAEG